MGIRRYLECTNLLVTYTLVFQLNLLKIKWKIFFITLFLLIWVIMSDVSLMLHNIFMNSSLEMFMLEMIPLHITKTKDMVCSCFIFVKIKA